MRIVALASADLYLSSLAGIWESSRDNRYAVNMKNTKKTIAKPQRNLVVKLSLLLNLEKEIEGALASSEGLGE